MPPLDSVLRSGRLVPAGSCLLSSSLTFEPITPWSIAEADAGLRPCSLSSLRAKMGSITRVAE